MATKTDPTLTNPVGDLYFELIRRFPLRHIRSDDELREANAMVRTLISRPLVDGEQDYLDVLCDLVERYEDETIPMRDVPDDELLRYLLDENSLTQTDLAKMIGVSTSTVCEILSGKRKFTRAQVGIVASRFALSIAAFRFEG